jgi:ubiquinone/menaquinone biosynthesis C-methylase UbiE
LNLGSTVKVLGMDTITTAPNHHGHHAGFAGLTGLVAASSMTVGRGHDARLAVRLAGLRAGDRVVDVGCGPGAAARHAARAGASVVGIDPARVMRRVARVLTFASPRVRFVDGAAEALPLPDGDATVLWSIATVHHWPDLDAGLAEAHRVLAPGGRFLAIERKTHLGATGLGSHGWTDEQAEAFAARCRAAGFEDVGVERHSSSRRTVLAVLARRP